MNKSRFAVRWAAVALGAALLTAVAGPAVADENHGDQDVDVNVSIAELTEPGVLAMTVAGTSTDLTENGSTELVRQFTGTLPTVTVTDTRSADEIPDGAGWYVLGSASVFTGETGQNPIGADHFGWTPRLIDGGDSGLVTEGDQVDTVLDDGDDAVGLVDQELLALALGSGAVAEEGQWTASADLFLRTDSTVEAGDYTGRLTLSLFE
ncbi:hypothetical protein [Microbacterium proteolyticum]|uniref:hypothetical protein n=1 Tax=Microbacterium proteolyticum TaxID=1572644 RepID=UPI001FACA3F5|nr:hypothetical protein [Microbacterium proteolyticum]MCI9857415.1 hypothetical protein [Microbacterium proteolyticum]